MANYATLKAAVQAVVKSNGNQEITGANLQSILFDIIDTIGDGAVEFNASEDGSTYESLSDVIELLPSAIQFPGVRVSFLDQNVRWHTYYCANNYFTSAASKWREIDINWNHAGTVNAPNINLLQCYTYTDNKNVLYGNKNYADKVNYIKFRVRNNGAYRFLGIFKVNISTKVVTPIRNIDILGKYTDGEIAEIPVPLITCSPNEYIAIDGSLWYAGQTASGTQNDATRFAINKDGTGYSEEASTPIGFVVGYKSEYESMLIKTSDWIDSSFGIMNSSVFPDLWFNKYHVDNAVGIKIKINGSTALETCSVYKVDYYGSNRQKICEIYITQYTDGDIVDVMFANTVYLSKTEYLAITSPFYYSGNNTLNKYARVRKYADGSINEEAGTFIGFMPITIDGLLNPMHRLTGKRISVLGDSISTYNGLPAVGNPYYPAGNVNAPEKMWYYQLDGLAGAIVNRVNAIGGCLIKGSDTGQVPCCAPSRYEALFSDGISGIAPDIVFIFAGVNDWNMGTDLGDYTQDYTAPYSTLTTFIPSYRNMLAGIQATYPTADIYCLTPCKSFYNATSLYPPTKNGHVLTDYVDAIKKCASLHGAKLIDLYDGVSINETNISSVLRDNLHPSLIGQSLIAEYIINHA